MLPPSLALSLALSCAPRVSPDVLLSVAYAESSWRELAIHDNVTQESFEPRSREEAERIASRLISQGHSPDLGLLQINAANLSRTGLTLLTAFDPCASMHAGAQILLEDYNGGTTSAGRQAAILHTFSAYNTGSPIAGLQTYAPRVLASARKVIPALRLADIAPYARPLAPASSASQLCAADDWHYSATHSCRADASWHFPAVADAAETLANPTTGTRPVRKEEP